MYALILFSSCNSIEKAHWKYRDGFHIGDVITFDSHFSLKNDTIYANKIPIAILVKIKARISDRLLILKDINGNSLGSYCNK
ncbi:hypothetical protein G1K97_02455 [Tenacibaculum finnmarkense]|uniref:hypothetical protein n=1 Tax=Tenacibaculum finnmarkense TaxID=2781243 RepID=UPI001EFBD088|nr:hypothetical protein [Tenacibaculum finnmarkense]MCG8893129.1 hypothetical protein [Tenacibaculum finnmarkense]MCG8900711.1 hypothetical protein [Tenacibaculum finnmarkense]